VAHLFGGSEKESLEIGTGEYNKKLDAKIADIKKQCNIQGGEGILRLTEQMAKLMEIEACYQ